MGGGDEDAMLAFLATPTEFERAPAWARTLYVEGRRERHETRVALHALVNDLDKIRGTLGNEPNSDDTGGNGLIGDVRRLSREVIELKSLKNAGLGFLAALSLTGALILAGVGQWITGIVHQIRS